jgi:hypothetical protein
VTVDTVWSPYATLSVQVGSGDTHTPTVVGVWGTSRWGDPTSGRWAGVEPLWADVTCDVQHLSIRRGVDYSTNRFPTSSSQLTAANASGWATTPLPDHLPTAPGTPVRFVAGAVDQAPVPIWSGYIDQMAPGYEAQTIPDVRVDAVDALSQLAGYDGLEVAPVGAGELAGARINRLLDLIGWPKVWRDIAAGQVAMQATNLARNLADEAGITADSEGGAIFATRDGRIAFRDRDWWRTTPTPAGITIGNVDPGSGIVVCPVGWEISHGLEDIVSVVSLSVAGGTVRQYQDATARSLYGMQGYRRYDLICQDPNQLDLLAGRILAVRARSGPRVRAVTLSVAADHRAAALIGLVDYATRVRAVHVDARGTVFDQTMLVTQIAHDVTPTEWTIRLGLESAAPYTPAQPWGVARWGIDRWSVAA